MFEFFVKNSSFECNNLGVRTLNLFLCVRASRVAYIFKKIFICIYFVLFASHHVYARSHGVMVSTLDFESSDPSSNLGGTYFVNITSEVT